MWTTNTGNFKHTAGWDKGGCTAANTELCRSRPYAWEKHQMKQVFCLLHFDTIYSVVQDGLEFAILYLPFCPAC